jgi:hypothetical protein
LKRLPGHIQDHLRKHSIRGSQLLALVEEVENEIRVYSVTVGARMAASTSAMDSEMAAVSSCHPQFLQPGHQIRVQERLPRAEQKIVDLVHLPPFLIDPDGEFRRHELGQVLNDFLTLFVLRIEARTSSRVTGKLFA